MSSLEGVEIIVVSDPKMVGQLRAIAEQLREADQNREPSVVVITGENIQGDLLGRQICGEGPADLIMSETAHDALINHPEFIELMEKRMARDSTFMLQALGRAERERPKFLEIDVNEPATPGARAVHHLRGRQGRKGSRY